MTVKDTFRLFCMVGLAAAAACHPPFQPLKFPSTASLYTASVQQLQKHHWDNAIAGFEHLSSSLPARDPRMPTSLFDLGKAYQGKGEDLLAAQSYSRVPESFPTDTLADDAMLAAGQAYARMWRKPTLDPTYGQTALSTLQTFLALFPTSPLRGVAQKEIGRLTEWFAIKDYDTAHLYFRRGAYDSSIIYLKSVVQSYPQTHAAHDAMVMLAEAYRKINYKEELSETCQTLRQRYPHDGDVRDACDGVPKMAAVVP
ncbi:MAG TPA: outer membrane protein assembly factor BamD [Gemmatimonadaceae bacterium]|nr:outer membrane protein assembly factor BamD [Gemmatimonadaceae bacterium]